MIVVMMIMMMLGKLLFSEKLDVLVREKKSMPSATKDRNSSPPHFTATTDFDANSV